MVNEWSDTVREASEKNASNTVPAIGSPSGKQQQLDADSGTFSSEEDSDSVVDSAMSEVGGDLGFQ